jgi:hypothetical protein
MPEPLILSDPTITISDVPLECLASHIEISPDTETTEVKTFCGTKEYAGNTKWYFRATLYQSFDTGGTDETLQAAVTGGVPVEAIVIPNGSGTVSATNPAITGMVIPKPFAIVNGDAGEASEIDLEWSYTAEPVRSPTAPVMAQASAGAGPAEE